MVWWTTKARREAKVVNAHTASMQFGCGNCVAVFYEWLSTVNLFCMWSMGVRAYSRAYSSRGAFQWSPLVLLPVCALKWLLGFACGCGFIALPQVDGRVAGMV